MRSTYLVIVLGLMLALTACGDDDSGSSPAPAADTAAPGAPDSSVAGDQGPAPVNDCGADCNGALANTPTASCQTHDAGYASGNVSCTVDCQVDVSQCVAAGPAPTVSPEFGECLDASQCEAGLECLGAAPGASGLCGTACTGEGDTSCGAGRECLGLNGGGGICFNQNAQRDQPCLGNGSTCAEGQGECVAVTFDELGNPSDTRCKLHCDGPDIGAQGTCPANETCMTNPVGYIKLEEDGAGNSVPCTIVGEQDVCGAGFTCLQTAAGQTVCAQQQGWCGDVVALCGELGNGAQTCGSCGAADDHAYCSIQGATGEPAGAECFIPPNSAAGICLGYCETDEGVDLDCGAGYECVIPPIEETIYVVPQGGEQQVPCTDDTQCDAAGGFTCLELSAGSTVCARPLKMCRTAATP